MEKRILIISIIILAIAYFIFFNNSPGKNIVPPQEGYVLSSSGIHWHSHLKIIINGKEQAVPEGIGLIGIEEPLHTHDFTGELHMENPNPSARPETMTLGYLFKLWGKPFNNTCIFEYCNGPQGQVKMYINGVENKRFGDFYMSDGDNIEIRYE